uniref:Uncharacterized protein n=1 Tax=Acrobeloides nanus TaxID=290746 RepID=A0A914DGN1_9BILA
MNQHPVSNHK